MCDKSMVKVMKNIFYLLICLFVLEVNLYFKDYNEVLIINNNVRHEFENIGDINLEKYKIIIKEKEYTIIYYRNSIFNFKFFKKIKYRGII